MREPGYGVNEITVGAPVLKVNSFDPIKLPPKGEELATGFRVQRGPAARG